MVDPDMCIMASYVRVGLFPAKMLVRRNLAVLSAVIYCTRVACDNQLGCPA